MKTTALPIALSLALCLFASCGQEEQSMPLPLEVSAGIAGDGMTSPNGTAVTKATTYSVTAANYDRTSFEEGDVIKITKGATSALYQKSGSYWTLCSGQSALTSTGGDSFTALFPENFTGIQPDQTTMAGFFNSNKLQATATSSGNHLALGFTHACAKITLVINYTSNFLPNKAEVTGTGMIGGSGSETVSLYRTSGSAEGTKHSYVGLVNAATYASYKIDVTTGSGATLDVKSYIETQSVRLTLRAGYNYQFTFTNSDELILTGVTVTDFDTQPEEDMGSAT